MLEEYLIKQLRRERLSDCEIKSVKDYDPQTRLITFKDGTVRRLSTIFTRCMGYFSPYNNFNTGKQSEFKERKWFKLKGENYEH